MSRSRRRGDVVGGRLLVTTLPRLPLVLAAAAWWLWPPPPPRILGAHAVTRGVPTTLMIPPAGTSSWATDGSRVYYVAPRAASPRRSSRSRLTGGEPVEIPHPPPGTDCVCSGTRSVSPRSWCAGPSRRCPPIPRGFPSGWCRSPGARRGGSETFERGVPTCLPTASAGPDLGRSDPHCPPRRVRVPSAGRGRGRPTTFGGHRTVGASAIRPGAPREWPTSGGSGRRRSRGRPLARCAPAPEGSGWGSDTTSSLEAPGLKLGNVVHQQVPQRSLRNP